MSKYKIDEAIIGKSKAIKEVKKKIRDFAPTGIPVLISGETGTGKQLAAQAIHELGEKKDGDFREQNCGGFDDALSGSELFGHVKGAFTGAEKGRRGELELADGGTLFLDEINSLSLKVQKKLLKVLDDGKFKPVGSSEVKTTKFRLVSASNENLRQLIDEGKFREDLFYRIKECEIKLPPLRDRGKDIIDLAEYFMDKFGTGKKYILSPSEIDKLVKYHWPGNIRELGGCVKTAIVNAEVTKKDELHIDLPKHKQAFLQIKKFSNEELIEHEFIEYVFDNFKAEESSEEITILFFRWLMLNNGDRDFLKTQFAKTKGTRGRSLNTLSAVLVAQKQTIYDISKAIDENKPIEDILRDTTHGPAVLKELSVQDKTEQGNKESEDSYYTDSNSRYIGNQRRIKEDKRYRDKMKLLNYEKFKAEMADIFEIISLKDVEKNITLFQNHGYIEYDFYSKIPYMMDVFYDWPFDLKGKKFYIFDELPYTHIQEDDIPHVEKNNKIFGSFFHCWRTALTTLFNLVQKYQIKPYGEGDDLNLDLSGGHKRSFKKIIEILNAINIPFSKLIHFPDYEDIQASYRQFETRGDDVNIAVERQERINIIEYILFHYKDEKNSEHASELFKQWLKEHRLDIKFLQNSVSVLKNDKPERSINKFKSILKVNPQGWDNVFKAIESGDEYYISEFLGAKVRASDAYWIWKNWDLSNKVLDSYNSNGGGPLCFRYKFPQIGFQEFEEISERFFQVIKLIDFQTNLYSLKNQKYITHDCYKRIFEVIKIFESSPFAADKSNIQQERQYKGFVWIISLKKLFELVRFAKKTSFGKNNSKIYLGNIDNKKFEKELKDTIRSIDYKTPDFLEIFAPKGFLAKLKELFSDPPE